MSPRFAVVLVNLGTPDAPTPAAVRRYLRQFLADPRVIDVAPWLWWFILRGVVLPLRAKRVAKIYQKVWLPEGSPLRVISERQRAALADYCQQQSLDVPVLLAMNYGNPSLSSVLNVLAEKNIDKILVLPLYPQYSATTTAAVFDQTVDLLKSWPVLPAMRMVLDYHDAPGYLQALIASIQSYWQTHGRGEQLIFSFHGIPQRYYEKGDPYPDRCRQTAALVAAGLGLAPSDWQITFQSRFGPATWVKPYTFDRLIELAQSGTQRVDVISPGFAADCLETLEELMIQNQEAFIAAGGKQFHYIPALNDDAAHIQFLYELMMQYSSGW